MENSPENLNYGNLPGQERKAIKTSLLEEQGYLCTYTMQRLGGVDDCHIEHVLPQNEAPDKDLDYGNMAGCFPKSGGDTAHGYGAPIKAGTLIVPNENFVTPHGLGCERRFRYDRNGGISPANGDAAAASTIQLLKLDHPTLMELRRSAIKAHGLVLRSGSNRARSKPISAAAARRLAEKVLQQDGNHRLEPFCVALYQVALEYADKEEARSQRMRAQHGE